MPALLATDSDKELHLTLRLLQVFRRRGQHFDQLFQTLSGFCARENSLGASCGLAGIQTPQLSRRIGYIPEGEDVVR